MPPVGVDALAGAARDLLDQAHVGVDRQVVAVVLERGRRDHDDDVVARGELGELGPGVLLVAEMRHALSPSVAGVPAGRGLAGGAARAQRDVLVGAALARARAARVEAAAARDGARRRAPRPRGSSARPRGTRAGARRDCDQRLRVRVLRQTLTSACFIAASARRQSSTLSPSETEKGSCWTGVR